MDVLEFNFQLFVRIVIAGRVRTDPREPFITLEFDNLQVCSILWSKHYKELVSSHGFAQNQLILWKYPSMTKVAELTGGLHNNNKILI